MMTQYYLKVNFSNVNFHVFGFYSQERQKQTKIAGSWVLTNLHSQSYKNFWAFLIVEVNEPFQKLLLAKGHHLNWICMGQVEWLQMGLASFFSNNLGGRYSEIHSL